MITVYFMSGSEAGYISGNNFYTTGGSRVGYVSGRQLYTASGVSAVQTGAARLLLI